MEKLDLLVQSVVRKIVWPFDPWLWRIFKVYFSMGQGARSYLMDVLHKYRIKKKKKLDVDGYGQVRKMYLGWPSMARNSRIYHGSTSKEKWEGPNSPTGLIWRKYDGCLRNQMVWVVNRWLLNLRTAMSPMLVRHFYPNMDRWQETNLSRRKLIIVIDRNSTVLKIGNTPLK